MGEYSVARLARSSCYLVGTLLLATSLAACGKSGEPTSLSAASPNELPIVPVAKVTRASLSESVVLTGEFQPYQEVDIMAKVPGYLKSILVDIGDRVREGQLLATLEVPEMDNDRTRAVSAVQAADADVVTARQELGQAIAAHDLAHLSYSRINDVNTKEPGLVPGQDVDVVHSRDLEAEARLGAAQSKLQASEQHRGMALAEQAHTETLYKYAQITAPFAAVVTKRYANVGSMIQAGTASQTQAMPVVRLSQNNLLRLILPVPESVVPSIRDGESVQINVRTIGKTIPGRVTRFSKTMEMSTRTMNTEVDVSNPDLVLVPGMYADVNLSTRKHSNSLCVPIDAIEGTGESTRAYVVDSSGVIHVVSVTVGIQTPLLAEILSGLNDGDTVIVGRLSGLQDGEHVQPKAASFEGASTPKAGS
jgi:RND family efflux transporter MFP subunit